MRFALLLLTVFVIAAVLTVILNRIFKKRRLVKYIPGLLSLLASIYYLYQSRLVNNSFEDIGMMIMGFIFLAGFAGGLLSGLFIDVIIPVIRNTKEM